MRTSEDFETVRRLLAAGVNDCEISRRTGVPRPTVRDWRCRPPAKMRRPTADAPCGVVHDFADLPVKDYCYLFGLYLGDGCISRMNRVWKLRISLDKKYPGIIDGCRRAINAVMPRQNASVDWQPQGCAVVGLYSKHWPCLFPQHGPGLKHRRLITLEPWQERLVEQAPEDFIRGLIHSDGCRVIANDRGVTSIRYHFTNHSEDILGLFTSTLDQLCIPWTRSTKYVVSIYRKAATARLDEFIGPKC
ncbi:helix-turn-helix domain-containing protein [Mycolicibacterium sphagni]|uniref:Helix-turn-helix domain-containing protein n=1 Tax=Mycolicibacterium sphagni TaxID=1786 RepID=A0ABX2K4X5_9MYCO|nr:helix-turn-helix domain-containing protein [Mycolicibacterium sphagni]NTY63903.1 helix-turn-helix domain-containing protein [Mycolicibacterium sphagni]